MHGVIDQMEFINFQELSDRKYRYDKKTASFESLDDYKSFFHLLISRLDDLESIGMVDDFINRTKALFNILIQLISDKEIIQRNNDEILFQDLKEIVLETVNGLNTIILTASNDEIDNPNKSSLKLFALLYSRLFQLIFTFFDNYFDQINQHAITLHFVVEKLIEAKKVEEILSRNNQLIDERDAAKQEVLRYINSQKNKPAVDLYEEIKTDFLDLEKKYRRYFVISIIVTLLIAIGYNPLIGLWANLLSIFCSFTYNFFEFCENVPNPSIYPINSDTLKFIFFKFGVLAVGITFTTYFLRLSSFYQLKQEQAKQTQLELSAFPDYVSGMDESVANNLRQELALKYFGKEIDKSLIDKNSDLIQDQLKAGTELIKASTDVVKTVKPNGINASSNKDANE